MRKCIRNSNKDMAQLMATLFSFPAQPVKETMRKQRCPMRGEKAVRTEGERLARLVCQVEKAPIIYSPGYAGI